MSLTLQTIINDVREEVGYSTGTNTNSKIINAINRSLESLKRELGMPSDEKKQEILFSADQVYYALGDDFDESILIKYQNDYYNRPGYLWSNYNYPDLIGNMSSSDDRKMSITTINGSKQLMMIGRNIRGGETLDAFEAVGSWVADDDASGLAVDTSFKYDGSASLSFDITNSTGVATLENADFDHDFKDLFNNEGYIRFQLYMTDNNIDDVTLKLMTDDSNYYSIIEDDQSDGTAFSEDAWFKVAFPMSAAVATGTPDSENITKCRIEFDLGAGFTSATDFRIDQMFTTYPDKMDLVYYSSYKGTDTTGVTNKVLLDTVTDKLAIGEIFQDYRDLVTEGAVIRLWPSLRGDKEILAMKKADYYKKLKLLGRTYPRKRTQTGSYRTSLQR